MSLYVRKRTFGLLYPAKIQINLCIHAVRSESSLDAFWITKDASLLHADNENSDLGCRWAHVRSIRRQNMPIQF